MKRLLGLFALALFVGCQPPAASEKGTESTPPDPTPQAPAPGTSADIDFAKWPTATDQPVRVDPQVFTYCRELSPAETQALEAARKRNGPHFAPSIVVRTNPEAIAAFKAAKAPLPAGTTIVKEKHIDREAKEAPYAYGAMIKREPGYDAEHGDWEYLYVVLTPEKTVTRGRLESCIDCHAHAKDKDYVFRTYLPGQAAPVSGW
jgi:hypothetical protein